MALLEDDSGPVDIDTIIINKNITDPKTIELLRNIALAKKKKVKNEKKKVKNEGASSSTSNSDKKENKIEATFQTSEAEAKVYLNPNINDSKPNSIFFVNPLATRMMMMILQMI
jgi:hypothetical protein